MSVGLGSAGASGEEGGWRVSVLGCGVPLRTGVRGSVEHTTASGLHRMQSHISLQRITSRISGRL
jgi:hypothetical protein